MKRKFFSIILVTLFSFVTSAVACTSVIVSGKVTPDGRPYIFKNRDTPNTDNLTVFVKGERYRYIAVVSANDSLPRGIWSGHNEAGFAIVNTAAYNLNGFQKPAPRTNRQEEPKENDSTIMRKALEKCATLDDFEHFLDSLKNVGPIPTNSNFAVLDANGGCAYYETGNKGYVKYDANDPAQAPYGYLVRTNHGMSGDRSMDKGIERYLAISDFMARASFEENGFDFENIIRNVPRLFVHGLTKLDINDFQPTDDKAPVYFPFRDFIPRYETASSHLIQGVKKGENPLLTISWVIPGSPLTTVAVPLLITDNGDMPKVITRNHNGRSSLVDAGFKLKKQLFPLTRGNGKEYINVAKLINKSGTGIVQKLRPVETAIFEKAKQVIEETRKNGKAGKETVSFYQWVDLYLNEQYSALFNLKL